MGRIIIVCFIFFPLCLFSQNIVLNGSFEEYTDCPEGLTEFNKVKFWFSPNGGTPDYFNSCYDSLFPALNRYRAPVASVPKNQLGNQRAKTGQGYAGIIVLDKKPVIIEYIKTRFSQSLEQNKKYCVQMYVSLADYSLYAVDRLGFYFSKENINISEWKNLEVIPQVVHAENNFLNSSLKWMWVAGEYTAVGGEEYLIIGNFDKPENRNRERTKAKENQFNYFADDILSYYYIDDVSVTEIIEENYCKEKLKFAALSSRDTLITLENMTTEDIKTGSNIVLKNIYFETDKSKLLKESYPELNKLFFLLQKFPKMKISINGHTDNTGDENHNLQLSQDRAKSVIKFLLGKGVGWERLNFYGFGSKSPIATNETEEGKQMNRRVEFKIVAVE